MIDKSDNNETDTINSEPEDTQLVKPPKARGAGFALFIAFLALFFTAAGIAAGYKHWQRMSDRAKNNAREIAALEEVVASKTDTQAVAAMFEEMSSTQAAQQEGIDDKLAKMNQMYRQTEQFSNTVMSQVKQITELQGSLQNAVAPDTPKAWHLAEVSFLLKLASRQLLLSGNREAASSALREADQILSEAGSVSYLPVRQQIAADLTAIEAVEMADIATLSQQITALIKQLKPRLDADFTTGVAAENAESTTDGSTAEPQQSEQDSAAVDESVKANDAASAWQDYKAKAANILRDAVIIRQMDEPLAAELSFEAREQAYQLLQLRLEALRLMALQRDDAAYQQQLTLIRTNISNYYPAEQAADIVQTLEQLAALKLNPELPDISGSLRQLEKARIAEVSQ